MRFREFILNAKEEISLVLQINKGYGFGFPTSPLMVSANLAGYVHESFITEPCPLPKFEIEFVWIMDKTKLKSIWSDKIPVRIECLTVRGAHRNRIGYIMLHLKDVPIMQNEDSNITEKQVQLLGLSKCESMLNPGLLISVYMTDVPIQSCKITPQFSPRPSEQPVIMGERPIKITLGALCHEHFLITVKPAANNGPKELSPEGVRYTYRLLGAEVTSDRTTGHGVQLAIASSRACLMAYLLHQPTARVRLHTGDTTLGETAVSLENLLLGDDIALRKGKQFSRSVTSRCEVTLADDATCSEPNTRPSIEFTISIRQEPLTTKKHLTVPPLLPVSSAGGGDADILRTAALETPGGKETYRTQESAHYTVTVVVTSLQIHGPHPRPQPHYWLKVNHPGGSVIPVEAVAVDATGDPQWQLSLTVPRPLLEPTLTAGPPTLCMGLGEEHVATARLTPPATISTLISGEQKATLCRDTEGVGGGEGEVMGEVAVTWTLSASDAASKPSTGVTDATTQRTPFRTGGSEFLSPREREIKILSYVEELEDWADKQRIIVMDELKEEKAVRLSHWEQEVGDQLTEGQQLVDTLHNMRHQLRLKEQDLHDKQLKLKVYKEELEEVHCNKLLEYKQLSRRMQDEFNHKLAIIANHKVAAEKEVEILQTHNDELLLQNAELRQCLREAQSQCEELNHNQKELREQLLIEQESKMFYKDQCHKAEREMERLSCLRQQELEARLSIEKQYLEQLAFHELIERNNHQNPVAQSITNVS